MELISPNKIAEFRDAQTGVLAMRLQEVEVCEYWGIIFSPKGIATLTKQDMTGFLSYRQNHRWREISKENVTDDMGRLRSALTVLTDDKLTIIERMNRLEPGKPESVSYFGKAKLTPILLVTRPREYGVWNDYSERALTLMGIMPKQTGTLGDRYAHINDVLTALACKYTVSLWRLDVILERIARTVR